MQTRTPEGAANLPKLIAAWFFVAIPFGWAVWVTARNASTLLR